MAAVRGLKIVPVPMEEACAEIRGVGQKLYDTAATFFG
jgi:hypothetical protein